MRGRVQSPATVTMADLERLAVKAGPYVMECAGNADPTNYGLMSAAAWEGAPLAAVLDRVQAAAGAHRILVTGMDDPGPAATSGPGASWIFSRDQLERAILSLWMHGGRAVDESRRLASTGDVRHVDPVDAHVEAGRLGAIPDRAARRQSRHPHAAPRPLLLHARSRNHRSLTRFLAMRQQFLVMP